MGIGGATFGVWFGKTAVHVLAHGSIWTICCLTMGPAGPGVATGLSTAWAGPIEIASNAVAIGMGITAGVATGPV